MNILSKAFYKIFMLMCFFANSCATSEPEEFLKSYEVIVNEYINEYKAYSDFEKILTAKISANVFYKLVKGEADKGAYTIIELRKLDNITEEGKKFKLFEN